MCSLKWAKHTSSPLCRSTRQLTQGSLLTSVLTASRLCAGPFCLLAEQSESRQGHGRRATRLEPELGRRVTLPPPPGPAWAPLLRQRERARDSGVATRGLGLLPTLGGSGPLPATWEARVAGIPGAPPPPPRGACSPLELASRDNARRLQDLRRSALSLSLPLPCSLHHQGSGRVRRQRWERPWPGSLAGAHEPQGTHSPDGGPRTPPSARGRLLRVSLGHRVLWAHCRFTLAVSCVPSCDPGCDLPSGSALKSRSPAPSSTGIFSFLWCFQGLF